MKGNHLGGEMYRLLPNSPFKNSSSWNHADLVGLTIFKSLFGNQHADQEFLLNRLMVYFRSVTQKMLDPNISREQVVSLGHQWQPLCTDFRTSAPCRVIMQPQDLTLLLSRIMDHGSLGLFASFLVLLKVLMATLDVVIFDSHLFCI